MIPDIYKKDDYGDMLRDTIADKNKRIKELEDKLAKVRGILDTYWISLPFNYREAMKKVIGDEK